MNEYKINENQRAEILKILAELPFKFSANLIGFFQNLKPIVEEKAVEEKKEKKKEK